MRSDDSDRVFEATLPDAPTEVLIRRVTGGSWPRLLAAHSLLAAAWIVLSNLLMHVPAALRGEPLDRLLVEAVSRAVEYGPAALAAYAALVIVGHSRASGRASGDPGGGASPDAASSEASDDERRSAPGHLAIRCGVRIHMVDRSEVRWLEADGDHVQVHTAEKSFRTRGTLTAYERELAADGFLRVHRSALVHPRAIREIQPFYRGDHVAVLRDGSEVRIPRTREDVLDALLAPTVEA